MPLNKTNTLNYWGNKDPICPHCDRVLNIADEELWGLYSEDCHDVECPFCEKVFVVISNATWSFSSEKLEDEEDE